MPAIRPPFPPAPDLRGAAILPAGPVVRANIEGGLGILAELGLTLAAADSLWGWPEEPRSWLAGDDGFRVDRLVEAIESAVDVLWMIRGGFGSARLIHHGCARIRAAQGARIASHGAALPLVAFSDGTALIAFWQREGWPAWSGPPVTQIPRLDGLSSARMRASLRAGMFAPFDDLTPIAPGSAAGWPFVANLCVLASLVGTPGCPDLAGQILILEDTGESPYKIDRLLTQLAQAGVLDGVAAVIFGDFVASRSPPDAILKDLDEVFRHFANEWAAPRSIPVARGLPIGHGTVNALLPSSPACELLARLTVPASGGLARLDWDDRRPSR